jgi:hypothetical protein
VEQEIVMSPALFIRIAPPLLAAVALAGCVSESPTTQAAGRDSGRQCFFTRDVQNFQAVSDPVVNRRVGINDIYRAELFAPCPDVKFTEGLAIRHTGGGGSAICSALDAELIVPTPTGPRTCALTAIRKLSPQEVAALPPRDKP